MINLFAQHDAAVGTCHEQDRRGQARAEGRAMRPTLPWARVLALERRCARCSS